MPPSSRTHAASSSSNTRTSTGTPSAARSRCALSRGRRMVELISFARRAAAFTSTSGSEPSPRMQYTSPSRRRRTTSGSSSITTTSSPSRISVSRSGIPCAPQPSSSTWPECGSSGAGRPDGYRRISSRVTRAWAIAGVSVIVPMVTSASVVKASWVIWPITSPWSPTTSDSSLVCERSRPLSSAGRSPNPARRATAPTSTGVTSTTSSVSTSACATTAAEGGTRMAPSARKKIAVKKSENELSWPRIRPLMGKRDTATPARKAPAASGMASVSARPMKANSTTSVARRNTSSSAWSRTSQGVSQRCTP